jgi:hypothetical protein
MYTTYHFNSVSEITSDVIDSIKIAFKGKSIVLTVEEEMYETAFLMANPINKAMLLKSIAQDKNGEAIAVTIPTEEV